MKVYSVICYHEDCDIIRGEIENSVSLIGCFSTEEKAKEIMTNLLNNFKDHGEKVKICITLMELDKPLEIYNFFMEN